MDGECLGLDWLFQRDDESAGGGGGWYMRVNSLTYTDPQVVRRVYGLALAVDRLLQQADIFYWTTGGTTLGIVRLTFTYSLHSAHCFIKQKCAGVGCRHKGKISFKRILLQWAEKFMAEKGMLLNTFIFFMHRICKFNF